MRSYRLLLFAFLLTLPYLSQAQSSQPIGGHFGLKLGASLTRLRVTGVTPYIPKQTLNLNLGVMYRYRLQRFVIQPELLLSERGGNFRLIRAGQQPTTVDNQYYYASVPLLLGYIPTEGLTIQAGPEFSYALNAGSDKGPGSRNDLGIVVGVHYDFLDMLEKFSLHIRYIRGLTNVSPEPLATYNNRTVQVSIVYNLYKKKK